MNKKNICFLVTNIFDLGGVQRVVSVLSNELIKTYNVDIVCVAKNVIEDRTVYNLNKDITVHIKPDLLDKNIFARIYSRFIREINSRSKIFENKKNLNYLINIYYPKKHQERLIKFINSKDYDIVIGVEGYLSIILGIIAPKINPKTIGWQHNSFDAYLKNKNRYYWKQNEIFKRFIPQLDRYVVLTNHDKEMFVKNLGIKSNVIYNPKSFTSNLKSSVNNQRFLAAGRFTYQKGFDLLVESFYEFSKHNSEWKLVLVGEGEDRDKIKSLIENYGLQDRISIEPFTNNIQKYFLNSSGLLLSSRWEGMPMIVLESMELGVPIISYKISSSKELIENNVDGILVNKFDTKEFAQAMIKLANSYELRKEMSCNAINKSKSFQIDVISLKWKEIFYELLN